MILVIGGSYQGKLEYVEENYDIKNVFKCDENTVEIDYNNDVIYGFQNLVLAHVRNKIDTLDFLNENFNNLQDKIIICDDISCGIVPIDFETRMWREKVGMSLKLISKNSDNVIRVFCGIGLKIK